MTPRSSSVCAQPTSSSWARQTWTSSPWALRQSIRPTALRATRGTSIASPAVLGAGLRRRLLRSKHRWRSAPTRAVPSVSPHRSPAPSAPSPPTALCRDMDSWPWRPALIRRVPARATCLIQRCCMQQSRVTIRATPPRSTRTCPMWSQLPVARMCEECALASSKNSAARDTRAASHSDSPRHWPSSSTWVRRLSRCPARTSSTHLARTT